MLRASILISAIGGPQRVFQPGVIVQAVQLFGGIGDAFTCIALWSRGFPRCESAADPQIGTWRIDDVPLSSVRQGTSTS